MSNQFAHAFKVGAAASSAKVVGPKGAINEATTGSFLMDFVGAITQASTRQEVKKHLDTAIQRAHTGEDMMRLVVAAMDFRDPRNGKGCKDVGAFMLLELFKHYPELVKSMVEFAPEFGCVQDYWKMIKFINQEMDASRTPTEIRKFYTPLVEEIAKHFWIALDKDYEILTQFETKYPEEERASHMDELRSQLSNAGKWAPSEKSHYGSKVHWFVETGEGRAQKLSVYKYLIHIKFGAHNPTLYKRVRGLFSKMRKICEVTEVKMCAKQYSEIDFKKVPGKCMLKSRKAFSNETKVPLEAFELETGNRFPQDEDRVTARKNLIEFLPRMKNGGTLAAYEIIKQMKTGRISATEEKVLESLWKAMVQRTRENIQAYIKDIRLKKAEEEGVPVEEVDVEDIGFDQVLSMIDVSGSMECPAGEGFTCMDLSISLGIVTSELNEGAFKHMAMSFDTTPMMHYFVHPDGREYTLREKFRTVMSKIGYSTDIGKAMDLILNIANKNSVPVGDLPSLVIYSDEGFDAQVRDYSDYTSSSDYWEEGTKITTSLWNTTYDNLCAKFTEAGYHNMPMIYFWNLRIGGTSSYGHQVQVDRKGVSMVNGWSNSSFKAVMSGQEIIATVEPEAEAGAPAKKSAWDDFLGTIDQDCYVYLRELCSQSSEKLLAGYEYDAGEPMEGRTPRTMETIRDRSIREFLEVIDEGEVCITESSGGATKPKTWGQTLFGM